MKAKYEVVVSMSIEDAIHLREQMLMCWGAEAGKGDTPYEKLYSSLDEILQSDKLKG